MEIVCQESAGKAMSETEINEGNVADKIAKLDGER